MKKIGVLNSQLSRIIAAMGHSDRLVICDSGLPIPRAGEVVDLALTRNIPRFLDTLRVVLEEAEFEGAIIANEMEKANPETFRLLQDFLKGIPVRCVTHEEFKQLTRNGERNTAFVRTGEATPYANVILIAGVTFD
jgi:D-ribose pyranase